MELEDIKFISKSKKITMAQCAHLMVYADGKLEESEYAALQLITSNILNITPNDFINNIPEYQQLSASLKLLNIEELTALAAFLSYVAKSDGHVAQIEIVIFEGLLRAGGMNDSLIQSITSTLR